MRRRIYDVLRQSEQYTKTDMVYLTTGGFWLSFSHLASSLAGFLLSVAFAHLVSKEVYGVYRYALSAAGIISAFSLTGLGPAVVQAAAQNLDGTLRAAFLKTLRWSLIMVTIAWGGALYYFLNDNTILSLSFFAIGLAAPFIQSGSLYGFFLMGKKEFATNARYTACQSLIPALLIIGALFVTDHPLVFIFLYFGAQAAVFSILYALTVRKAGHGAPVDTTALSFGAHLSGVNILTTIAHYLDRIIVFQFLGAAELAIYQFAINMPIFLKGILKSMYSLALPRFATRDIASIQAGMTRKILVLSFFATVLAVGYIAAAPLIYDILFPQYEASVAFSRVYVLILFAFAVSSLLTAALHAKKATRAVYVANISGGILRIGLYLILIPFFGIWGAVSAGVIGKFVDTGVLIALFRKLQ